MITSFFSGERRAGYYLLMKKIVLQYYLANKINEKKRKTTA